MNYVDPKLSDPPALIGTSSRDRNWPYTRSSISRRCTKSKASDGGACLFMFINRVVKCMLLSSSVSHPVSLVSYVIHS